MLGQFIFSTCNHAGLNLTAILRNTSREGKQSQRGLSTEDMHVSLKIFHVGVLEFDAPDFATIPLGGHVEVSEKTCPVLADDKREFLLIAHCKRGEGDQYFPQEHQVVYGRRESSRTTSLAYDQMPVVLGAKAKPIVLLAPKVWVSNDVNTFISFANVDNGHFDRVAETPWEITFLAQNGKRLHILTLGLKQNGCYVLDVKSALSGHVEFTDQLQMLNIVARGDGVWCVILTFVQNQRTGALALEHSLSPHYYMDGDFARVRKEAFLFPDIRGVSR